MSPATKLPALDPDGAPSPLEKSDQPSKPQPIKGTSLLRARKDRVAAHAAARRNESLAEAVDDDGVNEARYDRQRADFRPENRRVAAGATTVDDPRDAQASVDPRGGEGRVVARAAAVPQALPMRANWNAVLGPEALGDNRPAGGGCVPLGDASDRASDNHLRSTSYDYRQGELKGPGATSGDLRDGKAETGNPLRCALDGYCPVQLRESDHWVAGNPMLKAAYQGQEFYFSSNAAKERFEAEPERYAPAHGGNDVVLDVEQNRALPGSVNHSATWHGRLYVFSSSATLAAFQANPARFAAPPRETPLQLPANPL